MIQTASRAPKCVESVIRFSADFPISETFAAFAFNTASPFQLVHKALNCFIGHFQSDSNPGHCDVIIFRNQRRNSCFQFIFFLAILLVTLSVWRFGICNEGALKGGETDTQAVSPQLISRLFRAEFSAGAANGFNSAAPIFNEAGATENVCDVRIIRDGVMRLRQRVCCPAIRQNTAIADDHCLIFNADLNGRAVHIAVMHDGVVHGLAYRRSGKGIRLLSAVVLKGDLGFEIFEVNQINNFTGCYNQRLL